MEQCNVLARKTRANKTKTAENLTFSAVSFDGEIIRPNQPSRNALWNTNHLYPLKSLCFLVFVFHLSTLFPTLIVFPSGKFLDIIVEGFAVPVGVYVGGHRDVGMAHELLCYVDGDPGTLEICAEGVAQAIDIEVFGQLAFHDGTTLIKLGQRRQDKREAARDRREVNREKMELFSLQELMAVSAISRATAEAVQRIPDAHCNGEVKAALEYERDIRHKQRDFLEELGIHALHDD